MEHVFSTVFLRITFGHARAIDRKIVGTFDGFGTF
jgi:hypothetical protein